MVGLDKFHKETHTDPTCGGELRTRVGRVHTSRTQVQRELLALKNRRTFFEKCTRSFLGVL